MEFTIYRVTDNNKLKKLENIGCIIEYDNQPDQIIIRNVKFNMNSNVRIKIEKDSNNETYLYIYSCKGGRGYTPVILKSEDFYYMEVC